LPRRSAIFDGFQTQQIGALKADFAAVDTRNLRRQQAHQRMAVTLLPQPDSPTTPTVCPA
jgi:hypothetical protein